MSGPAPASVAVVGAGAAGLLAALHAARRGAPTLLLERTRDGGRKILISGGGRCNVLPSVARPERYVTASSPHALRRMLRSWPLDEQRAFFEAELGLELVREEETGKLFPASNRARDVRDGLVARVREAGARIRFETRVDAVEPPPAEGAPWTLRIDGAPAVEARAVVLATGGLSVPATGSDGRGLAVAAALGHTVHPTYPALTPLLADPPRHAHLAGVSLTVTLRAPGVGFETTGGFLFTHRGYSGPAVLDASHVAVLSARDGGHAPLEAAWEGRDAAAWESELTAGGATTVTSVVARHLPARLARTLVEEAGVPGERPLAQLRRDERVRLVALLTAYPLPWTGDEGYRKAEVTGGGVALAEVDPGTLESRVRPGLFLCGEMLDAFGPIGGHNFLWAWATGRAAGLGAAARVAAAG